jgi:hypothetical protein
VLSLISSSSNRVKTVVNKWVFFLFFPWSPARQLSNGARQQLQLQQREKRERERGRAFLGTFHNGGSRASPDRCLQQVAMQHVAMLVRGERDSGLDRGRAIASSRRCYCFN